MTLRFLAIPGCCCAGLGLGLEQGEPLRRKFITTSDVCFEVSGGKLWSWQWCYCPRASSREDGQRVCDFRAKCTFLKMEKHEQIAGLSASLPFRCTLYFVLIQRGCFKSDVHFCNVGKRCATTLIPQLVSSYPGSSLGSTKLGSRLRNEPLVCPWLKTVFWAASCSTCTILVYCI